MKPLLTLVRNMIVGLCWSIFFIEGVRVIMLRNWHFDIFNSEHWNYAWELWLRGVVIRSPKEWAFILILITFIPLLLTGWAALCLLPWEEVFRTIFHYPSKLFSKIFVKPVTVIKHTASLKAVKKKKSYKEVRPRAIREPLDDSVYQNAPQPATIKTTTTQSAPQTSIKPQSSPAPIPPAHSTITSSTPQVIVPSSLAQSSNEKFDHSLFQFDDDEDDFDFNLDMDEEKNTPTKDDNIKPSTTTTEKSSPKNKSSKEQPKNIGKKGADKDKNNNRNTSGNAANKNNDNNKPRTNNSVLEVLRQKGFEVIISSTIKGTLIDFIGLSSNKLCLCLLDKENGDWLADEERFNDEEPLWFSESSHRISPVRKVELARQALVEKLKENNLELDVIPYVVIPAGNIINAEDMFEIWNDMNILVTRIDRGTPKELKLFSKSLPEIENPIDKESLEKIKKLVRNIT